MLDSRPRGRGFEPHWRHCVVSLSKNIYPSLVLVQPRKTHPFITEILLMGRKESYQTKQNCIYTYSPFLRQHILVNDISMYNRIQTIFVPVHEILILTACAQKPPTNTHVDISSRARGQNFGLSLRLFIFIHSLCMREAKALASLLISQTQLSLCRCTLQ